MYQVFLEIDARAALRRLSNADKADLLRNCLYRLQTDPRPADAIPIDKLLPLYRIQSSNATVGYEVDDNHQRVAVWRILLDADLAGEDDSKFLEAIRRAMENP